MDPQRFDDLVHALTTAGSRRRAMRLLIGTLAALGAGRVDGALEAADPKHGHARNSDHPAAHDAATPRGAKKKHHHHHHHHHHPPPPVAGNCTATSDGSVHFTLDRPFNGQPLRLEQVVDPISNDDSPSSRLALTLGGVPLLTQEIAGVGRVVTVTVTYGAAFQGVRQAHFTNNGTTIEGDIDGQAIAPLPVDADPQQLRLATGDPPPQLAIDPPLGKAIQAILQQAGPSAEACNSLPGANGQAAATRRRGREAGKRTHAQSRQRKRKGQDLHRTDAPLSPLDPYLHCGASTFLVCSAANNVCMGLVEAACAPLAATLVGYGVCVGAGQDACLAAADRCRRQRLYDHGNGTVCCPTPCGGEPDTPFGAEPVCCELSQGCTDPTSNGSQCCPESAPFCIDATVFPPQIICCPPDRCLPNGGGCCTGTICGNTCCDSQDGCCSGSCCNSLETCCNGVCCSGTCCNGVCCHGVCANGSCCVSSQGYLCGNDCCPNDRRCCNGVCCPSGQVCNAQNQCSTQCAFMCNGQCCGQDEVCCGGQFCSTRGNCPG